MNCGKFRSMTVLLVALAARSFAATAASAQIQAAGGGYYVAGYGTVYGSFGQASDSENLYKTTQAQAKKAEVREAQVRKYGPAAVAKAEREAATGTSSNPKIAALLVPVVRNYGRFRPDATVDTGNAMADALGDIRRKKPSSSRYTRRPRRRTTNRPRPAAGRTTSPAA